MLINDDFTRRVVILPEDYAWRDSPTQGVRRMMLDRIGDEVARATTIVDYAPNSEFPAHIHDGGEEFLVLRGSFHDEHGDYPAGTYVRNPRGTMHRPRGGKDGARLFVKLHQFAPGDDVTVRVDTHRAIWQSFETHEEIMLYRFETEEVRLMRWSQGRSGEVCSGALGVELLVLEGSIVFEERRLSAGSWLRLPHGTSAHFAAGSDGTRAFLKCGHLSCA